MKLRMICILLCLCMVLPLTVACANEEEHQGSQASSDATEGATDAPSDTDGTEEYFHICAACGMQNVPHARFCIECGASLTESDTDATDVSGTGDESDAPDEADTDAPDTDAPDTDATDGTDAPDATDATDATDGTDATEGGATDPSNPDKEDPKEDDAVIGTQNVYVLEKDKKQVTIELCSPRMVRVQYSMNGDGGYRPDDPEYYMVQKEIFGAVEHTVTETENRIILRTSEMEIRVTKDYFLVSMYDLDGTLLSADVVPVYEKNGRVGVKKVEGTENAGGIFGFGSGDHGRRDELNRYNQDFSEFSMSHGRVVSPFFMSTVGYGAFLNTMSKETTFFRRGGGFETAEYLDYYLMYGPDFKTIQNEYAELTGRMELYGKWALGFMLSKYGNDNATQAEFLEWIHRLRDEGYPADCYVFDYGWRGDINVTTANHSAGQKWGNHMWSNDKTKFPDVSAMFDEARELGFHVGLHNNAGTPEASGGDKLFIPEYADKWVKAYMDSVITTGYGDFFWPDEFDVLGSNSAPVLSALGAYEAWKEYTDATRPMFMTRGSYAGQHFATAWSGDTDASESDLAYQIGFAIDTGLIGYWATSCDLGGFKTRPSDALYTRWTAEFGAWSAIMRTHGHDGREPWDYNETAQETLKENLRIRYALYPYLYSSMWQGYTTGVPIMRAMVLEDGSQYNPDAWNLNRQYYFGDWFLVAPATEARDTTVDVWFPPNTTWFNYYTGERYEGGENGKTVTLKVALDEIPVFVKAGAIVPMGPEVNYADELPLNPLTLDVYPNGTTSYTLYEDDGESRKYQTENAYATTTYTCVEKNGKVTFTVGKRFECNPDVYTPDERSYVIVLHHMGEVKGMTLDGNALSAVSSMEAFNASESGYYVDGTTVYVRFPDTAEEMILCVDAGQMRLPDEAEVEEIDPVEGAIEIKDGVTVELEDTTLVAMDSSVGLPVDTEWKGYTGTGFVKGFKTFGDYVTFNVNVTETGTYDLILRVNCGKKGSAVYDANPRTAALFIDDVRTHELAFAVTETWGDENKNGDWREYVIEDVVFTKGVHSIKISARGDHAGHYNLDSLRFEIPDNTTNGNAQVHADKATALGAFFVENGIASSAVNGAYLGFAEVKTSGEKKTFTVRVKCTTGGTLTVYETGVGDKILATLTLAASEEWQTLTVDCRDTDANPSPIYLSFVSDTDRLSVEFDYFTFG